MMLLLAAQGGQPQGNLFSMLLPMLLVFAVFYFLLIRPQQKQAKKHQQMLTTLRTGDDVVTRSGIHGRVTAIEEGICSVEIATNVRVRMNKDQIALVKNLDATPEKKSQKLSAV
ncbi:MAG: preprotein translocase subunit YajC [Deltaproteobacteria bacterium]|nr:preprotein translocase subunit YajC [Deltaproteobacteria bacterium]